MKRIDDDVLDVLRTVRCEGAHARLEGQLERGLYVKVNKVLQALGGKWNRTAKAHVFDGGDPQDLLSDVVTTGQYLDWRQELQFYETPRPLAEQMCEIAGADDETAILEPSAGRGALARVARDMGASVWCIEVHPKFADDLSSQGFHVTVGDFLQMTPDACYNAVVMNPPFRNGQDMGHVRYAFEFLIAGGVLVAVMSAGMTFRQDRKAVAFRAWLAQRGGTWEELPSGTFKESGTLVNAVLVTVRK